MAIFAIITGLSGLPAAVPDSLRLRVVFPVDGDTLAFDRVRYAGAALPDAEVYVQGRNPRVYPSGAFVGMVDLHDGFNHIIFTSRDELGLISDTVRVFRTPRRIFFPETPTVIDPNTIRPVQDVFLLSGEVLEVAFHGSPNGKAWFAVDSIATRVEMREVPPQKAHGLRGAYRGKFKAPMHAGVMPKRVVFDFRGRDGYGFKFQSEGRVRVLSDRMPVIGMTRDSTNIILREPEGDILTELPPGLRVQVTGLREEYYRVRLAAKVTGYLYHRNLELLPEGAEQPYAAIGNVALADDDEWTHVEIDVSERVPFRVRRTRRRSGIEVAFFRAVRSPQWVLRPADHAMIKKIRASPKNSDVFVVRLELHRQQAWGYRASYVGNQFRLSLRKPPASRGEWLLASLTIAVDAGHGGESEGGVSATGLLEKDLTLDLARSVQQGLDLAGATVIMTRSADTTVTLQSRIATARESRAHIFLSLHFNSIDPNVEPLQPRGASVYFTVPQSRALADFVHKRLTALSLPPYGVKTAPFAVTRQTDMLAILVEGAFLTHPEDEMLLLRAGFIQEMADAIVAGLRDFVVASLPPAIDSPSTVPSRP